MHEHIGERYQELLTDFEMIKYQDNPSCQDLWDIYKEIQIIDLPSVMRRSLASKNELNWVIQNFDSVTANQVKAWIVILFNVQAIYSDRSDDLYWKLIKLPNLDLNNPDLHDVIRLGHNYSDEVIRDIINRFKSNITNDSLSVYLYHPEVKIDLIDDILVKKLTFTQTSNLQNLLDNPNLDKTRIKNLRSILFNNGIPLTLRGVLNHKDVSYDWIMEELCSENEIIVTNTDIININTLCQKYTSFQKLNLCNKIPQLIDLGFYPNYIDVSVEILS